MIRFVCTCGHRFEVDDEQGGGAIQCPDCRRLSDIPTLQDLASFTNEGTYVLDADHGLPTDDPDRMADLEIIYAKDKHDAEGNEIDLRTIPAGRKNVGDFDDDQDHDASGELELKSVEGEMSDVAQRPKYDPETGELIRPIEVRSDPELDVNPARIPVAKAAISYATRSTRRGRDLLGVAVVVLQPGSLVVLGIVCATQMLLQILALFPARIFSIIGAAAGISIPLETFLFPILCLMMAHYGNVIEDSGPEEADELHRPLRNFSLFDDIWFPLTRMFFGLALCYLPSIVLYAVEPRLLEASLALSVLSGLAAPAVLLTTVTSGTVLNLRPDRVLGVIRTIRGQYLWSALLWIVLMPLWVASVVGPGGLRVLPTWLMLVPRRLLAGLDEPILYFSLVLATVYLMHVFCWHVGAMYRAHHDQFPWVLQRFIRDPHTTPHTTHADQLGRRRGRRRPMPGHLAHIPSSSLPPPPPPPPASHV